MVVAATEVAVEADTGEDILQGKVTLGARATGPKAKVKEASTLTAEDTVEVKGLMSLVVGTLNVATAGGVNNADSHMA